MWSLIKKVELWGVEPQASWMQIKRSTNWATTPIVLNLSLVLNSLIGLAFNFVYFDYRISIKKTMSLTAILKKMEKVDQKHRKI